MVCAMCNGVFDRIIDGRCPVCKRLVEVAHDAESAKASVVSLIPSIADVADVGKVDMPAMPAPVENANSVVFDGGTKRSCRKAPLFLVMPELMEEVAWTRYEGDNKYEPGNWMQGDKEFFIDCLAHSIDHLMNAPFDEHEDIYTHLGHAACNIGFVLWALRRGVITRDDFQNAARILKAPAKYTRGAE